MPVPLSKRPAFFFTKNLQLKKLTVFSEDTLYIFLPGLVLRKSRPQRGLQPSREHEKKIREHWIIYKEELSCGLMIRLNAPTPSPFSKLDPATHRKTEKEIQVANGRRGRGWAWKLIRPSQESLALYNIIKYSLSSVADPYPDPDPHVFGPPGSGSSIIKQN